MYIYIHTHMTYTIYTVSTIACSPALTSVRTHSVRSLAVALVIRHVTIYI